MNDIAVTTYNLTAIHVLGLAGLGIVLGEGILRALPVLSRLSVPRAILGGFVLAVAILVLRDRVINFKIDEELRKVLTVAFFSTVGLGASFRLLKVGGLGVVVFLLVSVLGLVLQMGFGAAAASGLGESPLFGLIPGAVSLTGGPATATAFGPVFEKAGVPGATTVGIAAAMLGIVISGILGGYVGSYLIRRDKLTSNQPDIVEPVDVDSGPGERHGSVLAHIVTLAIVMALGLLVTELLQKWKELPIYIGAMLVAAVARNLDDKYQLIGLDQQKVQDIGDVALELFIVMSLLGLKLWEVFALAGPTLIILAGQVVLTITLSWTLVYWWMGRTYTAAVMAGGYTGFMLGTTANAMASMKAIVVRTGPAPHAFFAVSIVGACLIDFINSLLITGAISILR